MKRREFLKSSAPLGIIAGMANSNLTRAAGTSAPGREYYELRLYHLRRGPMQKRFDDFFRDASVPAMNRAGISPVGVFNVFYGPDNPTAYVLLRHASAESIVTSMDRVRSDDEYRKRGAEFLNAPPGDPPYIRMESFLMGSIAGMPRLEVPPATSGGRPRLFELRTYESHSKTANRRKIEMFNEGELAIFRRVGLAPVFFGETLIGSKLPSLTYMLVFADIEERERNWDAFRKDPEWKKLSTTPGYTDPEIVTNVGNVFLRPTVYSQV